MKMITVYKLEHQKNPKPDVLLEVREGLCQFNQNILHTKRESIVAKDNQTIIGGALYTINHDAIYVDTLWLKEDVRHQGLGTQILDQLEAIAQENQCQHITLDTLDFQAENFYSKHGYKRLAEVPDCLFGHNRIFFRKTLK